MSQATLVLSDSDGDGADGDSNSSNNDGAEGDSNNSDSDAETVPAHPRGGATAAAAPQEGIQVLECAICAERTDKANPDHFCISLMFSDCDLCILLVVRSSGM